MGNEAMTTTTENQQPPKPLTQSIAVQGHDDGRSINAFASSEAFAVGQRMAIAFSQSTMVPTAYQGKENIPNCMIAMELANRIGASVFAVMQNIDVIHGRPAWRATFLIATVNACKRFTPIRFRFEGKPGTASHGCRAVARDREDGEECIGTLITIGMADAEGWSKKNGSKWKTMPEQMLMYRAAAFWTRVFAPELSLGMHTTDEVEDIGSVEIRRHDSGLQVSALADRIKPAEALPIRAAQDDAPSVEPRHDPETGEVDDDQDEAEEDDR